MKYENDSTNHSIILLSIITIFFLLLSRSQIIAQMGHETFIEHKMPDEYQVIYNVSIKSFISEAEQRRTYESEIASAKELKKKNKDIIVGVPDHFELIPARKFQIMFTQSKENFYWHSDEKSGPDTCIYDGKRSYYYEPISHRMYVYHDFKLFNGMILPLPGCSLSRIPLIIHPSQLNGGRIEGDIYCGDFNTKDKPVYLPGHIDLNMTSPSTITSAISYNKSKKYHEYLFSDYSTSIGLTLPRRIIENLYNQATKDKKDILLQQIKYELVSASHSALQTGIFDPNKLLKLEKEKNKASPVFVQWYFDDGRELTLFYEPGKSIEEQAGIEDYQRKKAVNRSENGKIDPRNYAGLGLLLVLLIAIGWKIASVLKARRKA